MPSARPAFCHIYAQFDQVGDLLSEDWEHIARLGLVADVVVSIDQAERHAATLRRVRDAGGLVSLTWYPRDADPRCVDANWWAYDDEACAGLVAVARERFAALGLGPLAALNTYTPGNGLIRACRAAGIGFITGFCAPTVIEDGGWSIAHYGSPLSPYFVSDEDFRKPTAPGDRAVLMASMELRNPLVCARHWSEGPWCPLNAQAADRWLEPSDQPWPFLRSAEDWLRQGELDGGQRFFHLNLQYFFAGACRGHNRHALEWLALQRDRGRLQIGGLSVWAARMRAEGGFVAQSTYWRGEMAGFHVGNRPGFYADVVVDESLERQAIFAHGEPLPQRLYDYRPVWSCHPFRPEGGDPISADTAGISVAVASEEVTPQHRRLRISVANGAATRRLPVAIWGELDGLSAPFTAATGEARILPHPAGVGGALLLEATWALGTTTISVDIHHAGRQVNDRHRRRWGSLIEAQTFVIDGRPCSVLAVQAPARVELTLRPSRAILAGALVEGLVGIERSAQGLPESGLRVIFDGTRLACWHRVWDRWCDEIELDGVDLAETHLRQRARALPGAPADIPAPGYVLHGDLLDQRRWDLAVGRLAGTTEIAAVDERLRTLEPRMDRAVIAAHPGADLPCGSITKVLGHRFDRIACDTGYSFRELCADYPQAWAPGVAGWVQWRHLNVAIAGLRPGLGAWRLHLHAFDPEGRGICQRVHLYDADARDEAQIDLCVVRSWDLPVGLENRFDRAAFRSIPIPEACLAWACIGVWISPLEAPQLHDWVAERGAPGVLMHLWVARELPA
ncbi:MAG: hypothetical protein H0W72_06040 [Planctomycetes bacterium]|nr:hypothetical protein [Planctomycetota bacterium]